MFPESLETDRLQFERLSHDTLDVRELYDVFGPNNPNADEVFKYVDSSPFRTVKEADDFVKRAEEQWDEATGGKYAIRPKETEKHSGELAGVAGLYPDWERRLATLGIVLDKQFWGRGYSGERAELFVSVAFDELDLAVVAIKHIDGNEQSKRAVENYVESFGGRYEGLLRNWLAAENDVYDCHRYTISRPEYESSSR